MKHFQFHEILRNDETLLWSGTPSLPQYLAGHRELWHTLGISVVLLCSFYVAEITTAERLFKWYLLPILAISFFIAILVVFVKRFLEHNHIAFGLTNSRILIRSGILVRCYKTIELDQLTKVEVDRDIFQALMGTGNVRFFTASDRNDYGDGSPRYDQWESVKAPYKLLQKILSVAG